MILTVGSLASSLGGNPKIALKRVVEHLGQTDVVDESFRLD